MGGCKLGPHPGSLLFCREHDPRVRVRVAIDPRLHTRVVTPPPPAPLEQYSADEEGPDHCIKPGCERIVGAGSMLFCSKHA